MREESRRSRLKLSREFISEVKKFDGNRCVICKTYGSLPCRYKVKCNKCGHTNQIQIFTNRLVVHHHWAMGNPYVKPTLENCVTLCASCHGKVTTESSSPIAKLLYQIIEKRSRRVPAIRNPPQGWGQVETLGRQTP